jgi:hypothetical protein
VVRAEPANRRLRPKERDPFFNQVPNRAHKRWVRSGGSRTRHLHSKCGGSLAGFDIEIVKNFHVIRCEPDWREKDVVHASLMQNAEVVQDVGAEPWLRWGAAAALINQVPALEAGTFGY